MNKIQNIINSVLATLVVVLFVLVFTLPRGVKTLETRAFALEGAELPIAYLNLDSVLNQYLFAVEASTILQTKQENARLELAQQEEVINKGATALRRQIEEFQTKIANNQFDEFMTSEQKQELEHLQQEMADYQRKLQYNAMTQERAQSEGARLQAALEKLNEKITNRAKQEESRLQKKQDELNAKLGELQARENELMNEIMQENQKLNQQFRDTLDNFLREYNAEHNYQIIFANAASDNVLLAQPGYDITEEVVAILNKRYNGK